MNFLCFLRIVASPRLDSKDYGLREKRVHASLSTVSIFIELQLLMKGERDYNSYHTLALNLDAHNA